MTTRNDALRCALALAAVASVGFAPAVQAKTASVLADDFSFSPATVKIKKNDKVRWTNVQGSHSVTMSKGGQDLDDILSGSGEVTSAKFKKKGSFSYLCTFHSDEGMKGKVVVR
ncbi:MAG: cupredoxin domain-containing protein [Thermoleophilaceae bacterium]|nr:cupredoxin domain-containing protein [Thermoleophilaceae bacterium]